MEKKVKKIAKPLQLNQKTILWILCAFVSIFLIILFIYGKSLSGTYLFFINPNKYISSQSNDWATFGTLLSGMFTLLGSFSTILTLLFLLNQNKENLDRADQQLKQTQFDKFKLHKEMFYSYLTDIEQDDNSEFKFLSKQKIYSEIFPLNDFDECNTRVELNALIDDPYPALQSKLIKIIELRDTILTKVHEGTYIKDPFALVNDIFNFNVMIGLVFTRPTRDGDVLMYNKTIVLNALSIKHAIYLVNSISLRLMSFTHSGSLLLDLKKFNSTDFTFSLLKLCKEFENKKRISATFPLNMIKISENIYTTLDFHFSVKKFHTSVMNLDKTIMYLEHYLDYFENLKSLENTDSYKLFFENASDLLEMEYKKIKLSPSCKLDYKVKLIALWAKCKICINHPRP